jgi:hypothetical protein
MAAAVIATGILGAMAPASANCYRVLAPNRWQYITQCNNSGGGGGGNYGAAIGAAGAIIEAAPAAMNVLGGIMNTGTDVMSGVASTSGRMVNSGADGGASTIPSPGQQGGGLPDPFSIFKQPAADQSSSKEADCAGMRQRLAPHAIDNAWIADQMARSGCRPNGKKMSLRERTKRGLEQQSRNVQLGWQNPPFELLRGALNSGAPKNAPRANQSTITGLGGN